MVLYSLTFYLFSSVAVLSALMVISAKNPVHSVLFLILSFVNASGLFVLLGAEFLAMILVVVYVGAVAVLFLFVVMMLDINFVKLREWLSYLSLLTLSLFFFYFTYLYFESAIGDFAQTESFISNTREIGIILYTEFTYAFIIAGILLLLAVVGAIAIIIILLFLFFAERGGRRYPLAYVLIAAIIGFMLVVGFLAD